MSPDSKKPSSRIQWPEGKKFAFTCFDDTDLATLENVRDVYAFLKDLGMHTTKSVWPLRGAGNWMIAGSTCEDEPYLKWCQQLKAQGFELGYHNSSFRGLGREDIKRALDQFHTHFGEDPKTMANHASQEAIYWGANRISGWRKPVYEWLSSKLSDNLDDDGGKFTFEGHIENSRFFWGDLCKQRIQYVRNFITSDINTLKAFPQMPYHDSLRPWVNYWYGASEGPRLEPFIECISERNQDRLVAEGGACIMYTHFSCGFQNGARLQPRFRALMERLARLGGWFVTVGELLDYLRSQSPDREIQPMARAWLETRWLAHKLTTRGST